MLKIALVIFLIAHGLAHAGLAAAPNPDDPKVKPGAFFTASERSWLLPKLGLNASAIQWVGIILVVLTALGFVFAGLGVIGVTGLVMIWPTVAVVSACVSLVLLVLFWHPWLPVGILIDLGILLALLWNEWPQQI